MQVSMNPTTLGAFVLLCRLVGSVQSSLPSHHNPARASVSFAGGSVAVSDWRNTANVIFESPAPSGNFTFSNFPLAQCIGRTDCLQFDKFADDGTQVIGNARQRSQRTFLAAI